MHADFVKFERAVDLLLSEMQSRDSLKAVEEPLDLVSLRAVGTSCRERLSQRCESMHLALDSHLGPAHPGQGVGIASTQPDATVDLLVLPPLVWKQPLKQGGFESCELPFDVRSGEMLVTVTLTRGAVRMAHGQVIVKRLSAVHDLGAMDVLCSDKTVTLTEARIRLIREVDSSGKDSSDILTWPMSLRFRNRA